MQSIQIIVPRDLWEWASTKGVELAGTDYFAGLVRILLRDYRSSVEAGSPKPLADDPGGERIPRQVTLPPDLWDWAKKHDDADESASGSRLVRRLLLTLKQSAPATAKA